MELFCIDLWLVCYLFEKVIITHPKCLYATISDDYLCITNKLTYHYSSGRETWIWNTNNKQVNGMKECRLSSKIIIQLWMNGYFSMKKESIFTKKYIASICICFDVEILHIFLWKCKIVFNFNIEFTKASSVGLYRQKHLHACKVKLVIWI